nr:S-layer homology domain-containing protein [uncultured Catonella sp.]
MENKKRRTICRKCQSRSLLTRLLAFALCLVLALTYSGTNTFAMSEGTSSDSEREIIDFSSLPDGVQEQAIRQGEDLSAVTDSRHPLTVTGGTEDIDYKWEDYAYYLNGGVVQYPVVRKYMLHILSSEALVIEGDATRFKDADGTPDGKGGAIVIREGVKANITLKNTKIHPGDYIPPMNVMKGAECNLTLEGENTLIPRIIFVAAGQGVKLTVPAVWVPENAKLTVTKESTGTLTASSAYENAVIGGWKEHHSGDITINGGTLKLDNFGALNSITNISGPCIGGYGNCGTIEINGGKIEATCVQSAPIGTAVSGTADQGGKITINGGNVDTDFDQTRPRTSYDYGYRVKITLSGAGEGQTISSYTLFDGSTISLQDTKTLPNGELYLWLPVNTVVTGVRCGGDDYTGTVRAVYNDTDAQAVFKKGTTGTLTASIKAEHVQGVKLSQTTGLSAGDTVYLSFDGVDSGYLFKGMRLYTGTVVPPAPREVGTEFTKIKDKLYSFTMPAENVTVYLNAPKIRTVSAGERTHIVGVSFNPTANLTVGDMVNLSYITESDWKVSGMALRKATDHATNPQDISPAFTKLSDNNYQFTMPDYDVCVDFRCEKDTISGVEVGDFVVSDATCSYTFDESDHVLTLSGNGKASISMKSGVSSTAHRIKVAAGSSINLTIKDLTISSARSGLVFPNGIGECSLILVGNNTVKASDYLQSAVHKQTNGKLTILGNGKLTAIATGGGDSSGIGDLYGCQNLYIESGTIYAKGNRAMGIGNGTSTGRNTVYYKGGTVEGVFDGVATGDYLGGITGENTEIIIIGGSIHSVNNERGFYRHKKPENGSTRVYLTTITLGTGATLAKQAYVTAPLVGAGNYGINHMHTDDEGKLYLWLPNGTTVTKVETDKGIYTGSVTTNSNGFGDAAAVFTLVEKQAGSGSVAIEGWTYGESANAPVPTSTTNGTGNVSYTYFTNEACTTKTTSDNSGADSEGGVPKNAGNYWVQATFAETARYKAVIAKAGFAIKKAIVSFTAPTPKTGLTYTGERQELINAGRVDSAIGKMQYSLSETGTYSEIIPKKENAGSYSVYYKVAGTNANYDYTNAKGSVEVVIAKAELTPTVAITDWTYGTAHHAPTVTGNTGNGTVTYKYFIDAACTTKTTTANSGAESEGGIPKNAGTYWVQATIAETANHKGATAKAGFRISKANQAALAISEVTGKKFGEPAFTLTTTGGSGDGAVSYSVPMGNGILEINGNMATIIGVGKVTITAQKAADNNYNETSTEREITIAKGDAPAITFPAASGLTYGQKLSDSTLNGGSTQYGSFAWADGNIIPTADNTGYEVVFTPNEATKKNYDISEQRQKVAVNVDRQQQTGFAIKPILPKTYGDAAFQPETTGGSGNGAVSYSVPADNGVLEINGDTVKIIGAGTATLTAKKAADMNYEEISTGVSLTIAKKPLTVKADNKTVKKGDTLPTFTAIADGLVNGDTFTNATFTLTPSTANTDIVGEYEITVSGGTLKKTDGKNVSDSYKITYQKGKLIVKEAYEVKVIEGTGSGKYAAGETVNIKANDKSGYTFAKWTGSDGVVFADATAKATSFVMPAKAVTVTADYRANIGLSPYVSSERGDNDGTITIKPEKAPDLPIIAEITVKAKKGKDNTAKAKLSEKTAEKAIKKAKEEAKKKGKEANGIALEINMIMPKGTDKVQMKLSESTLEKMVNGEVKHLTVNGSFVKVVFDKNAVFEIKKQSSRNVLLNIIPMKKLSKKAKKHIGKRPIYDISIRAGNSKKITAFGNGKATVFLSYKAEKKETIGGLYAVYVNEKGRASRIEPSTYDVNSGSVIFTTNHLSIYGVGYTVPSEKFDDTKNHWAKDYIDYVAGRGLITGSTKNTFSPNEKMTRAMLVTALGRLAGMNIKEYETNSFSDVQNDSSYRPYIEWAHSKGIVYGIGDGTFAPDKSITREEMAVILERYAKATGYNLPVSREASIYADKESIGSGYREAVTAMQQSGIMMGIDGNKFGPKGTATRAEVSAMLGRYIKLTITTETAQGFALDDAGKYRYYKDGKALTGKQTINGMVYFFDESGVLQTGRVKDGNRWRYYDGAKAHKGWLYLKADGEEKIYYLNKEGLLESGKWVKIKGKWYYFYSDGTLAVNTQIDGYEVDSKGVRKKK